MDLDQGLRQRLIEFQKNEITEHHIYKKLARTVRQEDNRKTLEQIASEELKHYEIWKSYTGKEIKADRWKVCKYYLVSRILGLTFGIKLMEAGEEDAQKQYGALKGHVPGAETILREEHEHEGLLIDMIDEERLQYIGSIVLGLNDALVELTGALAGFTLALRDTSLIALTGLITGIAAALSMAASEYLSTKSEATSRNPLKASFYTGIAYVFTVSVLIFPYLFLANVYACLACTLTTAIIIIAFFNYYISIAKGFAFKKRFIEMASISLGVAALSVLLGFIIRIFLGVDR